MQAIKLSKIYYGLIRGINMALWQFDCYLVPKQKIATCEMLDKDEVLSWDACNISSIDIDFLEKQESWAQDIVQYGKDNETCIRLLYENGLIQEISCRFDLRSLSKKLLEQVLSFCLKMGGLIYYEGKIYPPSSNEIVELMKSSKANKFCQNPTKYLEETSEY